MGYSQVFVGDSCYLKYKYILTADSMDCYEITTHRIGGITIYDCN